MRLLLLPLLFATPLHALVIANSGAKREYSGTVEGTGNGTAQLFMKMEANS